MSVITYDIAPKLLYKPLYDEWQPEIRIIDLWGGRSRGGSHEATLYAMYRLQSPSYTRIALLRQVYSDIRTSLWQDLKDRIEDSEGNFDNYNIIENEMKITNKLTGNFAKGFGVKADGGRTAKLKSIAGYNLVVGEEMDELNEDDFNTLNVSLRTVKGMQPVIIRVFNPPGARHWIWNDYNLKESNVDGYWMAEPKASANHLISIHDTYRGNASNLAPTTIELLERFKDANPWYYYTMVQGLISEGQKGRIYTNWQTISDLDYYKQSGKEVYVLDFGWSESKMALVRCRFDKGNVYLHELIYEPMGLKELAIKLCELGIMQGDLIIADNAQAGHIRKLRTGFREEITKQEAERYPQLLTGFSVKGCIKNKIEDDILRVKDFNVFVTESSKNIWAEYQEYKWSLDKDKNPTHIPTGADHLMDAIKYGCVAYGRLF